MLCEYYFAFFAVKFTAKNANCSAKKREGIVNLYKNPNAMVGVMKYCKSFNYLGESGGCNCKVLFDGVVGCVVAGAEDPPTSFNLSGPPD